MTGWIEPPDRDVAAESDVPEHPFIGHWTPHADFKSLCSPWTVFAVIEDEMLPYHGAYYQWDSGFWFDCSVRDMRAMIERVRAVKS